MDPLEQIWEQVSKPAKDKNNYIFLKNEQDIIYLYASGFVDARKYTYEKWLESFKKSKRSDGSYVLSKDQWLSKKDYHYRGPVNPPFDPMTLEEKVYEQDDLIKILKEKFLPGTIFDESYVRTYLNNLKAQGRWEGGKIRLDKQAKEFMVSLLNQFPSPMRVLEVSVHGMLRTKKGNQQSSQKNIQKSQFASGKTAQQIAAIRLADIAQSAIKDDPMVQPDKPAISVKDLQKKRSGPGRI